MEQCEGWHPWFTNPDFIWYCPESGFAAFVGDFELESEEKNRVADYLERRASDLETSPSLAQKLALAEEIYALRNLDAARGNWLLRVLAYLHETSLGNPLTANEYRRRAHSEIVSFLEEDLPIEKRLEYLFLAARYCEDFGRPTDSIGYEQDLRTLAATVGEDAAPFAGYLLETLEEYRLQLAEERDE